MRWLQDNVKLLKLEFLNGITVRKKKFHEDRGDKRAMAQSKAAQDTTYALHQIGLERLKNFIFSDMLSHHKGIQALSRRSVENFSTKHLTEAAHATYAIANLVATATTVKLVAGTVVMDHGVMQTEQQVGFFSRAFHSAESGLKSIESLGMSSLADIEKGVTKFHGDREHKTIGVAQ